MLSTEKIYYNRPSLILFALITLIFFIIYTFFIFLSIPTAIIAVLFIILFLKKINYVIYIDNYLHILSNFFIPKKIEFSQFVKISCENVGLGRSKDVLIYVHYNDAGKIKKSILLNFRILGKERVLKFINKIDLEKINVESFRIIDIDYKNGKFIAV
ncbi:hypothetical protein EZL74_10785 [Flavobacterium silvisoli]|uniref:Transmembrane protein n=1 Tax=Flavobacterium silvisoli TaxID=2529433 RepID=A0A4V2L4G1_9FLAO|nr:hypothetical protein [Flavobacterium silvisoli]TBX66660.1 hypothetical protein EZL74_10785 [Flavobacterium silvisoli]